MARSRAGKVKEGREERKLGSLEGSAVRAKAGTWAGKAATLGWPDSWRPGHSCLGTASGKRTWRGDERSRRGSDCGALLPGCRPAGSAELPSPLPLSPPRCWGRSYRLSRSRAPAAGAQWLPWPLADGALPRPALPSPSLPGRFWSSIPLCSSVRKSPF